MTPSFIKKPTVVGVPEEKHKEFFEIKTISGHDIEKQYSLQSGELTNTFYGSPVSYSRRKSAYDSGTSNYR